jgi:hypothetical protein
MEQMTYLLPPGYLWKRTDGQCDVQHQCGQLNLDHFAPRQCIAEVICIRAVMRRSIRAQSAIASPTSVSENCRRTTDNMYTLCSSPSGTTIGQGIEQQFTFSYQPRRVAFSEIDPEARSVLDLQNRSSMKKRSHFMFSARRSLRISSTVNADRPQTVGWGIAGQAKRDCAAVSWLRREQRRCPRQSLNFSLDAATTRFLPFAFRRRLLPPRGLSEMSQISTFSRPCTVVE